jgi:hypothetical protein
VPGTPQAVPFTTVAGTLIYFVSLLGGFVLQAAIVRAVVADINSGRASFVDCLTTGLEGASAGDLIHPSYLTGHYPPPRPSQWWGCR